MRDWSLVRSGARAIVTRSESQTSNLLQWPREAVSAERPDTSEFSRDRAGESPEIDHRDIETVDDLNEEFTNYLRDSLRIVATHTYIRRFK